MYKHKQDKQNGGKIEFKHKHPWILEIYFWG